MVITVPLRKWLAEIAEKDCVLCTVYDYVYNLHCLPSIACTVCNYCFLPVCLVYDFMSTFYCFVSVTLFRVDFLVDSVIIWFDLSNVVISLL